MDEPGLGKARGSVASFPQGSNRKGKKSPHRALNVKERDFLFALYEKHGANMSNLVLDPQCLFKSYAAIRHYCHQHHFYDRFLQNRQKKADEVLAGLKDSKVLAIQRAADILQPRIEPLRRKDNSVITDLDGNPLTVTIMPEAKDVKIAWEILKAELGEPTSISKADVHNHEDQNVRQALDEIAKLTSHAKPQDNGDAVPSERGAPEDTATVSGALPDNPHSQPSAQ